MLVFCSYTLKDGVVTVEKLKAVKKLISEFATCYIDALDNDSENKQERVFQELNRANVLLVLISPDIKKSEWVNIEYDIAEKRSIPVLEVDAGHIETDINFLKKQILNLTM